MKTVIMAGGKGTRISSVRNDIPKPMIPVLGKPVLFYLIQWLKKNNQTDIIIVIGHLGKFIVDYFGTGKDLGVNIEYINEEKPLGTAGALYFLKDKIDSDFLLINGDIICDVDLNRFYLEHKRNNGIATVFVHPNNHPYDSGVIEYDSDGAVQNWYSKEDARTWYKNCVNAGIHILSPEIFTMFSKIEKVDLDRDILKKLIPQKKLYVYKSPEYVKDMGTPERYKEVEVDIRNGTPERRNLKNKQKAVFFDRDGTINEYVGFLKNIDDFELKESAVKLIKEANTCGYPVIVVTNQPVIARGDVTWEELNEIHKKMETLLGKKGVYIDDIFICPHHPDSGFPGERKEYKVQCNCRKPKPGMFFEAARKYNIELSNSIMIGDSENDFEAAKAAGIKQIYDINTDEIIIN